MRSASFMDKYSALDDVSLRFLPGNLTFVTHESSNCIAFKNSKDYP